jgi:hypothetical protein
MRRAEDEYREERMGIVWGTEQKICRFEGSKAVPAYPSDKGRL